MTFAKKTLEDLLALIPVAATVAASRGQRRINLKIQGVMVNQEGRSGVLVNGQVFEEGEYVSDELVVKAVQEEQVTFVFRGLTLIRTL